MSVDIPCRKTMCATCPFREGSRYEHLRTTLALSALSEATRECHSTGSNAINRRTGLPAYICRGARDLQLQMFAAIGFIQEATDEAWNEQRVSMGYQPTVMQDPPRKVQRGQREAG